MENKILHGDSLDLLKELDDDSVDSIVTDPPYGYSFMGKDWDKAVPSTELWRECLRVLKPGAFAFVMSAPRSDVQAEMIRRLQEAGFRVDFTPVYWTYATGFPKAMNVGKMVDKKLGVERTVVGEKEMIDLETGRGHGRDADGNVINKGVFVSKGTKSIKNITIATSSKAKDLDGSYGGYQPKPAVEVIIVVMKPLSEKTYIDQAMKNQKGITWLDDCRVPFASDSDSEGSGFWGITKEEQSEALSNYHTKHKGYDDGSYSGNKKKSSDYEQYIKNNVAGQKNFGDSYEEGSGKNYEGGWGKPSRKKKSDYDKYVEKQKLFKGAKTIGKVNEGGTTFLGGDMKQLNPSETYQKPKTTKRKPRSEGSVFKSSGFKSENNDTAEASPMGRFPANLLVQDDVLNDGRIMKYSVTKGVSSGKERFFGENNEPQIKTGYSDEGSFSRYYDLDAWWEERIKELPLNVQATYPFMIVPKASKSEKNKGLDDFEKKSRSDANKMMGKSGNFKTGSGNDRTTEFKNNHPTVKPISLMSYLVTLGSRENDLVLDPFVGSGTTCISAKLLKRKYIGMEMDSEYVVIAKKRIEECDKSKKVDYRQESLFD